MLTLGSEQETAVRAAASRAGIGVEAFLAQAVAAGLAQLVGAAGIKGLDADDDDPYRPPVGVAVAREAGDVELLGRGYVPEPKAPRMFRARCRDGVRVASQIAFGPEPGPTLFIRDGERGAVTDVIMPLHWILIDMAPPGWRLMLAALDDAVVKLRAGAKVPARYGADPAWGYDLPAGFRP